MKKTTPFGEIEIADAHAHLFSRRFFETLISQSPALSKEADAMAKVRELTGWVMPEGEPERLAEAWANEFDRHGVSSALLIASVPGDEQSIAAAASARPDRIRGAFMLDPTRADAVERAKRAFDEQGLRVACLFPAMHHYSVAECEGARGVAELAEARPGTAVFVHCGALSVGVRRKLGLASRFDMRYSNPLDLAKPAAEFPRANFIIPHFGAGLFKETLMVADLCPNIFIDTSSSNKWMSYEPSGITLPQVFRRALEVAGHERLLFGTDSSFFPRGWNSAIFDAQVDALREIDASYDQAREILGGNLRRLLSPGGPSSNNE
jgi:predicted TIM-barrel fold metal-dependent hydrolase